MVAGDAQGRGGEAQAAGRAPRVRWPLRRWLALALLALLAAVAAAWGARDRLATALLVPRLLAALGEAGWQAALPEARVELAPDLSALRLQGAGLELRAREPGAVLRALQADELGARAELADLLAGRWSGVTLEARGVRVELDLAAAGGEDAGDAPELPELHLDDVALRLHAAARPPLDLRLEELDLQPGPGGVLEGRLRGQAFGGRLELQGRRESDPSLLAGTLDVADLDLAAAVAWALPGEAPLPPVRATLQGRVELAPGAGGLRDVLAASQASLQVDLATDEARLQAQASLRDGAIELTGATLSGRGGRLEGASARLVLAPEWLDSELSLQGRVDFDDLAPAGALVGPLLAPWLDRLPGGVELAPADFAGTLRGELALAGPLRRPRLRVDVAGSGVRLAGLHCGDLALRARDEAGLLQVEALELAAPGGRLSGRGALDLGTLELRDVDLEASLVAGAAPDDVLALLSARLLPGVRGELQVQVALSGPLARPEIALLAQAAALELGGTPLTDLRLDALVAGDVARVREAALRGASGAARAAGRVDGLAWPPRALHLDTLVLEDGRRSLQLEQPVTLRVDDGRLSCSPVLLSGGGASLALDLSSTATDGGTRYVADLELHDAGTGPLLDLAPAGVGAASLEGGLHAELALAPDGPGDVLLRGRIEVHGARLAGVTAGGGRIGLQLDLAGPARAPTGTLELSAGDVTLALPERLAALLEALAGGREIEVVEQAPRPVADELGPCRLWLALRVEPGALRVTALELEAAEELRLQASGSVATGLDLAAALRGEPALDLQAALEGTLQLAALDLERFAGVLGRVRRLQGRLDAQGSLSGTLAEPRLQGELALHDGELRVATGLPAVTALRARLALDGAEARIVEFGGELGAAPFTVSGGASLRAGGVMLGVRLKGEDLLLWRGQGVSVRADVDLALTGPAEAPRAVGRVVLSDAHLRRNLSVASLAGAPEGVRGPLQLFAFAEPPLRGTALDVTVGAHAPLRIENNIVRGGLVPELHLGGTGGQPLVTGSVLVSDLRLALPATVLRVTHGRLDFRENDPYAPSLDILAEARLRGYDVRVRASGAHDQPAFELSSVPPLPGEDVLLLVLTGQPPRAAGTAQGAGAARTVALYFGQDLLSRWVGETGDGENLVDRLEVDWERDATYRDAESIRLSWRLAGRPGEDQRLVFLHAERDVWDDVNLGLRWLFTLQ